MVRPSVVPTGLGWSRSCLPSAEALGYNRSPLRGWGASEAPVLNAVVLIAAAPPGLEGSSHLSPHELREVALGAAQALGLGFPTAVVAIVFQLDAHDAVVAGVLQPSHDF